MKKHHESFSDIARWRDNLIRPLKIKRLTAPGFSLLTSCKTLRHIQQGSIDCDGNKTSHGQSRQNKKLPHDACRQCSFRNLISLLRLRNWKLMSFVNRSKPSGTVAHSIAGGRTTMKRRKLGRLAETIRGPSVGFKSPLITMANLLRFEVLVMRSIIFRVSCFWCVTLALNE